MVKKEHWLFVVNFAVEIKETILFRAGSMVLAGLRSVSMGAVINPKKKEKADILEVYILIAAFEELKKIPAVYAILSDDNKKKDI